MIYMQDFSSNLFASTPSELAKTSLDDDQEEIEVFEIDTDDSANLSTQVKSMLNYYKE